MSRALVAGGTGLVGRELLAALAQDGRWSRIVAPVRRPAAGLPPEVETAVVTFDDPAAAVDAALHGAGSTALDAAGVDDVFCALGTTIRTAGSQAEFRRVDLELPLAIARAARGRGARHFLLVSAAGADPDSRTFYSRVKGELEGAVAGLGYPSVTIVRPSFLLGARAERRPAELVGKHLGRLLPRRWRSVQASDVAAALVEAAAHPRPGVRIIENAEIG